MQQIRETRNRGAGGGRGTCRPVPPKSPELQTHQCGKGDALKTGTPSLPLKVLCTVILGEGFTQVPPSVVRGQEGPRRPSEPLPPAPRQAQPGRAAREAHPRPARLFLAVRPHGAGGRSGSTAAGPSQPVPGAFPRPLQPVTLNATVTQRRCVPRKRVPFRRSKSKMGLSGPKPASRQGCALPPGIPGEAFPPLSLLLEAPSLLTRSPPSSAGLRPPPASPLRPPGVSCLRLRDCPGPTR